MLRRSSCSAIFICTNGSSRPFADPFTRSGRAGLCHRPKADIGIPPCRLLHRTLLVVLLGPSRGIALDISSSGLQISFVSNDVVLVIGLPQMLLESGPESLFDTYDVLRRCHTFEHLHDRGQMRSSLRIDSVVQGEEAVQVIGHDDEFIKNDGWEPSGKRPPNVLDHLPSIIEFEVTVTNGPEARVAYI